MSIKTSKIEEPNWDALTIADGYLFASVMQNKRLCCGVVQRLLEIKDISSVEHLETEKEIKREYLSKGVRLDVYVQGKDEAFYNLELQAKNTKELHKRARYYSSTVDAKLLKAGENYIRITDKNTYEFHCTGNSFVIKLTYCIYKRFCLRIKEELSNMLESVFNPFTLKGKVVKNRFTVLC